MHARLHGTDITFIERAFTFNLVPQEASDEHRAKQAIRMLELSIFEQVS